MKLAELKQLFVFDDYKETYRRVLAEIMKLDNKKSDVEWVQPPNITLNDLIAIKEQPRQVSDDNNL